MDHTFERCAHLEGDNNKQKAERKRKVKRLSVVVGGESACQDMQTCSQVTRRRQFDEVPYSGDNIALDDMIRVSLRRYMDRRDLLLTYSWQESPRREGDPDDYQWAIYVDLGELTRTS